VLRKDELSSLPVGLATWRAIADAYANAYHGAQAGFLPVIVPFLGEQLYWRSGLTSRTYQ
jgi:hypothetical protein